MTEPLLEIKGVRKQFGGLSALAGLDMHVDAGEILSVIGPNGAGKTTLFNLVTGVYPPDGGEIEFEGLAPDRVLYIGSASKRLTPGGFNRPKARSRTMCMPWFITGFLIAVAINSLAIVPAFLTNSALTMSKVMLLLAVTATAMRSRLEFLFELGWRATIPVLCATCISFAAALVLALVIF